MLNRPVLVVNADVGVLHRHLHVGVSSKFFGLNKGRTVLEQLGDVRVSPRGVKICNAFFRFVRKPNPPELLLEPFARTRRRSYLAEPGALPTTRQ